MSLILFKLLALYKENHPLSRFYFNLALLLGDNLIIPLLYANNCKKARHLIFFYVVLCLRFMSAVMTYRILN